MFANANSVNAETISAKPIELVSNEGYYHKNIKVTVEIGIPRFESNSVRFQIYDPDNYFDGLNASVLKSTPAFEKFVKGNYKNGDELMLTGFFVPWNDGSAGGLLRVDDIKSAPGFFGGPWPWMVGLFVIGVALGGKKTATVESKEGSPTESEQQNKAS